MLLKNIPLTKSDFEEIEWEELIKDCKSRDCFYYSPIFYSKAHDADAEEDEKKAELFTLMGALTSLRLKPSSLTDPLIPAIVTHESRSSIINNL